MASLMSRARIAQQGLALETALAIQLLQVKSSMHSARGVLASCGRAVPLHLFHMFVALAVLPHMCSSKWQNAAHA